MASYPPIPAFTVQRIFIMLSILSATAFLRASTASAAAAAGKSRYRRSFAPHASFITSDAKLTSSPMPATRLLHARSTTRTPLYPLRPSAITTNRYQLHMSTSATSSTTTSLVGINRIRSLVADTLNEIFGSDTGEQPQSSSTLPTHYTLRDAMVTAATKPEFGDYQCNAAMSLSKKLGYKNPRECAQQIVNALEPKLQGIMELPLEIAGPGFINLKLDDGYLSKALGEMALDSGGRLAVPLTE
jgi:hypothetical protein